MYKFIFVLFFIVFNYSICFSACVLDCLLYPGTVCVDNVCVPKSTIPTPTPKPGPIATNPTPTPAVTPVSNKISTVSIEAKPWNKVTPQYLKCSEIDLINLKVYLKKIYPGKVSYYSTLYQNYYDATGKLIEVYYWARKDILNKYVFIQSEATPQFFGEDTAFDTWENPAYKEIFKNLNCSEISNYLFFYGISRKGDMSDFEGASFIILNQ